MTPVFVHLIACAACGTTDAALAVTPCPLCEGARRDVAVIDGAVLAPAHTQITVTPCPKESLTRELIAVAPDGTRTPLFNGPKAIAVQLSAIAPRIRELATGGAS